MISKEAKKTNKTHNTTEIEIGFVVAEATRKNTILFL